MRAAPRSPRPPDSVTSAARPCPPLPRGRPAGRPGCGGPSRERRWGPCCLCWGLAGAGALAQADTILRTVPTPLYGFMLRARAYELVRDAPRARRAYAGFLRYETAERTRRRPEYAEHQNTIDAFHAEAVRATGGKAS